MGSLSDAEGDVAGVWMSDADALAMPLRPSEAADALDEDEDEEEEDANTSNGRVSDCTSVTS